MEKTKKLQEQVFMTLSEIQDEVVGIALSKHNNDVDMEEFLNEVTYETIYGVMEMIDGYIKESIKLDLIYRVTEISIRERIELHDTCTKFLEVELLWIHKYGKTNFIKH